MNSFYDLQNEKVFNDRIEALKIQAVDKTYTWKSSPMIIVKTENDYKHEYVPRRRLAPRASGTNATTII